MDDSAIMVTGATGQQGGAVIRHLRERGLPVRAMVRDESGSAVARLEALGCEVVVGDLDRPASLPDALDGVRAAFLVMALSTADAEITRGRHFVQAAKVAGLEYLVYSAALDVQDQTGVEHFDSKYQLMRELSESGLHHTVLGPGGFMENLLYPQAWRGLAKGNLTTPFRIDVPQALVAVDDIGRFAALCLQAPPAQTGQFIPLYSECLSSIEQAEAISRWLGRPVKAKRLPWIFTRLFLGRQLTGMFDYFNGRQAPDLPSNRQFMEALGVPTRLSDWLAKQDKPT